MYVLHPVVSCYIPAPVAVRGWFAYPRVTDWSSTHRFPVTPTLKWTHLPSPIHQPFGNPPGVVKATTRGGWHRCERSAVVALERQTGAEGCEGHWVTGSLVLLGRWNWDGDDQPGWDGWPNLMVHWKPNLALYLFEGWLGYNWPMRHYL